MKNRKKLVIFVISFFIFIITGYIIITFLSYSVCKNTFSQLPEFYGQEFIRVKIYGSTYSKTGNTISAIISIIDSGGNDIATVERSWSGSYLAVEFAEVKIQDKVFPFPSKIYSKNRIIEEKVEVKRGINLEKYYNYNNQCFLFTEGYSDEDRKNLYKLSQYATRKYPLFSFGQVNIYSVDLSDCRPYIFYSIGVDSEGHCFLSEL